MIDKIIGWNKEYCEDLGEKDSDGFSYAYRYFVYQFVLEGGSKVKIRRYTDTPSECSLFGIYNAIEELIERPLDDTFIYNDESIAAIIQFMTKQEGIQTITYFLNKGYRPIDINKIKMSSLTQYRLQEMKL